MDILVTGAGGFIGHHLVNELVARGERVRAVDVKLPEYAPSQAHEFLLLDLRDREAAERAVADIDEVYMLAANMGGIGFIERRRGEGVAADIVHDNTLINLLTLEAAREAGVKRAFFASSACIYPQHLQQEADVTPLKEEDAWPSDPEDGYGHEKLYAECLCRFYREDYGLETRVARFHNIYGPLGTWDGGREKSPAAIARKVALAPDGGEIEVWGDGLQTRSYCYVSDCVEGILRLMRSDHAQPLNIGDDRLVTINELVEIVARVAGKRIRRRHDLTKAQGVRGRNSDNTRCEELLGWRPQVSLEQGMEQTYIWIEEQLRQAGRIG